MASVEADRPSFRVNALIRDAVLGFAPFGLIVAALFLASWFSPALAVERVALVLGNSDYLHEPQLRNPSNDAADVGGALRALGFHVIEGLNLDKAATDRKLREFIAASDGADIALLFYAGHGVQLDGRNFLVPTDAALRRRADLDFELIDVERVVTSVESGARTTLVILDACRDNPLAANLAPQAERSIAVSRGLSPIAVSGAGTLIAYSTAPGHVAADGAGRNSPFTSALLRNIATPGLEIKALMTRVRSEVAKATSDQQIPWETESLRNDIFLVPALPIPPPAPTPSPASNVDALADAPCAALVNPTATEAAVLAADVNAGLAACALAVTENPDERRFVTLLRVAREQLAFKSAMTSRERERSDAYLLVYPKGRFVEAVRKHLAEVSSVAAPSVLAATPVATPVTTPTPTPVSTPEIDRTELVSKLERELGRVGCYKGSVDGAWGAGLSNAASAFATQTGAPYLDVTGPTLTLLNAVAAKTGTVCAPPAVAPTPAPTPQASPPVSLARPKPKPERPRPAATERPPGRGGCFNVGGLQYCN